MLPLLSFKASFSTSQKEKKCIFNSESYTYETCKPSFCNSFQTASLIKMTVQLKNAFPILCASPTSYTYKKLLDKVSNCTRSLTWTTHSREHTTLLEATTLQEAQLCTTLELDVQHCNRFLLVHIHIE